MDTTVDPRCEVPVLYVEEYRASDVCDAVNLLRGGCKAVQIAFYNAYTFEGLLDAIKNLLASLQLEGELFTLSGELPAAGADSTDCMIATVTRESNNRYGAG